MNRTVLATLCEEQILQRFKAIKYQTEKTRIARTWLTMTSQPQVTSRYTGRERHRAKFAFFRSMEFSLWSSATAVYYYASKSCKRSSEVRTKERQSARTMFHGRPTNSPTTVFSWSCLRQQHNRAEPKTMGDSNGVQTIAPSGRRRRQTEGNRRSR